MNYMEDWSGDVFSTTGSKTYSARGHKLIIEKLKEKGFSIVGEFSCLGYDTALSPTGINQGKPDMQDLESAREFASRLLH